MKKLILILLLGMFFIGFSSAVITNTTMLSDDFESDFSLWDDNGATDWDLATDQFVSGAQSAHCGSAQNDLISDNLDMTGAQAIYINFTYRINNIDANDNIAIYYYDGATYDLIDEIGDDAEDTWLTFSQKVTDSQYFTSNFRIYFEGSSIDTNEDLWVDDVLIIKEADTNAAPTIDNISASHSIIKGGNTITIYANTTFNGVNDTDVDPLSLYCDSTDTPTPVNTDCTGGTTTDTTYPYDLTCTFPTPVDSTPHTQYCRIYDGSLYSSVVNLTYTTDSTHPTTTIQSVAGDTTASYFDSVNDVSTLINVSGESSMSCRWSSSDQAYSSMSNDCTIDGTVSSCNVTDSLSQGFHTYYVSCQDQYTNEQNSTNNLDVSFFLDYTAPTTTDNSNTNIQAPTYSVTITEQDNVDSDPTSYYCTDTVNSCTPTTSIDNGGEVSFTSSNRGTNYLRYYSVDDAGNTQTTQSSTININQLPVFTSATDNVTTIPGSDLVNITTLSSDPDSSQSITMYVCDSANATFEGCGGIEYCNVTGSSNLSCSFNAETSSGTYTWYAYLFDDSDEAATTNPLTGSYTVDTTAPTITVNSPTNDSTITQSSVTFSITVDEALSFGWYSLNGGTTNVTMTNTTLLSYSNTNSSVPDSSYDLIFYANDSYGNLQIANGYSFVVDSTATDTTPPTITIQSPMNNTYYTSASQLLNITTNEDLSWAGYSINGSSIVNLGNTSTTSWNATYSFIEGTNNITFYANDTSSNLNQGNESITIYVDLNNPEVNFSCLDQNDSVDVNCSFNSSDSVGLSHAIVSWNSTGTWQNSTNISLTGTNSEDIFTILLGNTSVGDFSTRVYVFDDSGRINSSETDIVTISDDTFPKIDSIIYVPNSTDSLDDGVSVDINATITEDYNISYVKLMYKNSSVSDWNYLDMRNNSNLVVGGSSSIVYNATITLAEENWTFKINSSDYQGNINISQEYNLIVQDDVSYWNLTNILNTESFTYSQRSGNNSLGELFLNNTGDGTLIFDVNISSAIESRFDVNYTSSQDAQFGASSSDNLTLVILVNTTDLTSGLYPYNISVSSNAGSYVYEKQLNIQTASGPYLVVNIDTYSASVIRGQDNVSLVASVTNLGTQDAQDVYLNWTLPEGFNLSSGALNRSLGVLPIGISGTNSIVINVSSDITNSSLTVFANSSYSNSTEVVDSKTITILDPVTITSTSVSSGGGSGGSGGGAGGGSQEIVYDKIVEIVRGEKDIFEIEIENIYPNSTIEDIKVEIEGFLDQYVVLSSLSIESVPYGGIGRVKVNVSSPTYKSYEEHDLIVKIKGVLVKPNARFAYVETQNIKLIIQEVSRFQAEKSLNDSRDAIIEMIEEGFYIEEVSKLFERAETAFDEKRIYKESYDFSQRIIEIKNSAIESEDLLRRVIFALNDPKKSNLLVGKAILKSEKYDTESSLRDLLLGDESFSSPEVEELIELGILAFERGGYEVALSRAREARNLLVLERKGNLILFLYLNWHYLVSLIIILTFVGILWHRIYEKRNIGKRIIDINREERNIRKKEIENQRQYFKEKKSIQSYKVETMQNENKLIKLKKERMNLRNRRIKLLSFREIVKELNYERKEVGQEIKNVQKGYYRDKTLSKKEYDLQFEALNERLAEIEGETTTLELMQNKKSNKIHRKVNRKIDKNMKKKVKKKIKHEVKKKKVKKKVKKK